MRIRYKVALVGGIPITLAAAIAVIAWLLLNEAERTRNGAVLAGAAYRDLLGATTARNDYMRALPAERGQHSVRFSEHAESVLAQLDGLALLARDAAHRQAVADARQALMHYRDRMQELVRVTARNDQLIAEMGTRAASLIELTNKARERQHASNADIIASLTDGDRRLRLARDIVDRAHELRDAIVAVRFQDMQLPAPSVSVDAKTSARHLTFGLARLRNATKDLVEVLQGDGRNAVADELLGLVRGPEVRGQDPSGVDGASALEAARDPNTLQRLNDRVDRLIKVYATEQRALHDEVAQLLTYAVAAGETEQVTQTIAITSLTLGRRTADALASRDVAAIDAILEDSQAVGSTVASLPISPLIQTEMIDAIERWRQGLDTASHGLGVQNAILADMNATADTMTTGAAALNDLFTSDADRIGHFVRNMLVLGAAVGLLLGSGTALLTARSITEPLQRLQQQMIDLAASPAAGPITDSKRKDELGAMARAANFFVQEISRREQALREAKEHADATLAELRETQANLIQAEKMASLGQLVAGVAHEINTPLGVALTTSTALDREVQRLGDMVASGRLSRSEFVGAVERVIEGSRLLQANLNRAINLVYSFKQVAADQASDERRSFDVSTWLGELLTSLGPVLRKAGHEVTVRCPPDRVLDTFPGALAQVLTNLIMNAVAHAYPDQRSGHLTVDVSQPRPQCLRIVFADDGIGIPPQNLGKIFDPFFTTGRDRGGTGLGLHIVYNLVTVKLHGSIAVSSLPGRGTSFTIELPVTVPDPSPGLLPSTQEGQPA